MIIVRKLIWDSWNIQHIAKHNITPDEVEAVCHGLPVIFQGQKKKRLVVLGPTKENIIVAVILESQGRGRYYPITAYEADKSDIVLYNKLKGGVKK